MSELEQLLGLFVAAVILAAAARRAGAPYPVFLALGGALLAFFPARPRSASLPSLRWRSSSRLCCSMPLTTPRFETSGIIGRR